ncbi:hypothetical protein MBANPS3_010341 [Mucor bainieri]
MFARPIVLQSASRARALLNRLRGNEEMGKLITSLDLKVVRKKNIKAYLDLLPLVFTSAMMSFQGTIMMKPVFFEHLIGIAKASNTSFSRLKAIPAGDGSYFSEDYYGAICYFKESLQDVHIAWHLTMRDPFVLFNRLDPLNHLTTLTIDGEIDSVHTLDRMLSRFSSSTRLQVLKVLPQKTVPSVTKLIIEQAQQADIVEYLLYKYPNVKEATVALAESQRYQDRKVRYPHEYYQQRRLNVCGGIHQEAAKTQRLCRVIDALQNVPFCRIAYMNHILESVLYGGLL